MAFYGHLLQHMTVWCTFCGSIKAAHVLPCASRSRTWTFGTAAAGTRWLRAPRHWRIDLTVSQRAGAVVQSLACSAAVLLLFFFLFILFWLSVSFRRRLASDRNCIWRRDWLTGNAETRRSATSVSRFARACHPGTITMCNVACATDAWQLHRARMLHVLLSALFTCTQHVYRYLFLIG